MVTRLDGPATVFLPFNQGDDGAAGNPVNPNGGHRTAYLWEAGLGARELARDPRPLPHRPAGQEEADRAGHLPAVPPARRDAQAPGGGAGGRAGRQVSHPALGRLGQDELHRLDGALPRRAARRAAQEGVRHGAGGLRPQRDRLAAPGGALRLPAHRPAWWRRSRATTAARAASWRQALSGDKKIVVCTIQTFPFALEAVRELAATQGKRFAVIADEAHSSQTGEAAAKLKAVLSPEELAELDDGGEVSTEDILAAQMAARADDARHHLRRVHGHAEDQDDGAVRHAAGPARKPAGRTIVPAPFHVYSMRQAIEEKFILDVLQNYTTYKLAFKLAHDGKDYDEKTVERSAAMKGIMGWVRLHPYNIAQKVRDRRRALPPARGAAARRPGQGDGGGGQPRGGRALASWPSRSTSRSAATRSARWWRSPAR